MRQQLQCLGTASDREQCVRLLLENKPNVLKLPLNIIKGIGHEGGGGN